MEIQEIARIGLLFLDGDDFENVLIDKIGPTDYNFELFNRLKNDLLSIEALDPEAGICAILWARYSAQSNVLIPLIAGSSLPVEGSRRKVGNPELLKVFTTGRPALKQREKGMFSYYAPLLNSQGDIAGVLELLGGLTDMIDVSYRDMFYPKRADNLQPAEVIE